MADVEERSLGDRALDRQSSRQPPHLMMNALTLHHVVVPENIPELRTIHEEAKHTAMFYITTILVFYICGLCVILVHYMNQQHGAWNWTCLDVWEELKPKRRKERDPTSEGNRRSTVVSINDHDEGASPEEVQPRRSPLHVKFSGIRNSFRKKYGRGNTHSDGERLEECLDNSLDHSHHLDHSLCSSYIGEHGSPATNTKEHSQ